MAKIYFLIDMDLKETYIPICDLSNRLYVSNVTNVLLESKIQYENGYKTGMLFSVDENHRKEFNNILDDMGFKYEIIFPNEKSLDKEETYIYIYPNVSLQRNGITLNEGWSAKEDGIKIYVRSKEKACHFYPHVHFEYKTKEKTLVVNICDFKIIKNSINNSKIEKKCIDLLKKNLLLAKEAWNMSDAPMKFKVNQDGMITDQIYNSERENG